MAMWESAANTTALSRIFEITQVSFISKNLITSDELNSTFCTPAIPDKIFSTVVTGLSLRSSKNYE